jgi:death-on-curing protein
MTKNNPGIHYLNIDDFRIIFEQLLSAQEEYSEDLPPFDTRYPNRLESIINQVQATYFKEELYKDFATKAAIFFYLLNKDHPFVNGNKRISVVALYEFLERNVSELYISEESLSNDFFEMAIKAAGSLPDNMEEVLSYLKEKITSFIVTE